jgi:hypothetical protein
MEECTKSTAADEKRCESVKTSNSFQPSAYRKYRQA